MTSTSPQAQGGRGRRLTNDTHVESHPSWSPDGRHLVFERVPTDGDVELQVISALGGDVAPLKIAGIEVLGEPDWSPDGNWIAFTARKESQKQLALFSVTSRETLLVADTKDAAEPSWAPDSRHIWHAPKGMRCGSSTRRANAASALCRISATFLNLAGAANARR